MRRGLSLEFKKSQGVDRLTPSKVTPPLAADPVQPDSSTPLDLGADLDLGNGASTVTPEIAAFPARMMSQEDSYDRRNSLYPIQAPEELAAATSTVDLSHISTMPAVPVEAARFLDIDEIILYKNQAAIETMLTSIAKDQHPPTGEKHADLQRLLSLGEPRYFSIAQVTEILMNGSSDYNLAALIDLLEPAWPDPSKRKLDMLLAAGLTTGQITKVLAHDGGRLTLEALLNLFVPADNGSETSLNSLLVKFRFEVQDIVDILSKCGGAGILQLLVKLMPKVPAHCLAKKCIESIVAIAKAKACSHRLTYLLGILTNKNRTEFYDTPEKFCSICNVLKKQRITTYELMGRYSDPEVLLKENCLLEQQESVRQSRSVATSMPAASTFTSETDESLPAVPVEAARFLNIDEIILCKNQAAIETMLTSIAKDQHPPTGEMHADLQRLLSLGEPRYFSIEQVTQILMNGSSDYNLAALIDLLEPAWHDPSKRKLDMLLEAGFTIEQIIKILAHYGGSLTLAALLNLFVPAENGSGTPLELLKNFKFEVKDIVDILSKCGGYLALEALIELMPKVPAHCLAKECIESIAALAKKDGRSYHLNYLLGILTDKKLTEFYDTPEKFCSICNFLKKQRIKTHELMDHYSDPKVLLKENCLLEQKRNTSKRKSARKSKSAKAVATSMPPASTFTPETDESFVARMMDQLYSYNGSSLQPPEELSAIISTVDLAHIATAPEDAAAQQTRKRKRNDEQEQERPRSRRRKKASAASAISASAQLPLTPSEGLLPYLEATTSVIPDISDLSPLISSENFNLENSTGFLNLGSAISEGPIAAQSTVDAVNVTVESIAAVVDVDVDVTVESRAAAQQTRKRKRDEEHEPTSLQRQKTASTLPPLLLCQSTLFGCDLSSLPVGGQNLANNPVRDWVSLEAVEDNTVEFAKKFS